VSSSHLPLLLDPKAIALKACVDEDSVAHILVRETLISAGERTCLLSYLLNHRSMHAYSFCSMIDIATYRVICLCALIKRQASPKYSHINRLRWYTLLKPCLHLKIPLHPFTKVKTISTSLTTPKLEIIASVKVRVLLIFVFFSFFLYISGTP
jgi:membrane-associated HD superfamily phosphohydrolase